MIFLKIVGLVLWAAFAWAMGHEPGGLKDGLNNSAPTEVAGR